MDDSDKQYYPAGKQLINTFPVEYISIVSRRDFFAAMAMQAIIQNGSYANSDEMICKSAAQIADLMIKELDDET